MRKVLVLRVRLVLPDTGNAWSTLHYVNLIQDALTRLLMMDSLSPHHCPTVQVALQEEQDESLG